MPVWLSFPSRPSKADASETAAARASPPRPPPPHTKHILVFFVPGNPGFIDYYEPFLRTLRSLLDEVEDRSRRDGRQDTRFHILGRNLLGFEDGDDGGGAYGPGPFPLDTQIRGVLDAVAAARIDLGQEGGPRHGGAFDEVVLMGHSVGSYIALDVFRRHRQALPSSKRVPAASSTSRPLPSVRDPLGGTDHLNLRLGILLFATLVHLARSERGRKLERILLTTPVVSGWADLLVQAVLWWLLPRWLLRLFVRWILRFPPHAAAVTLRFLTSRGGVRQALFLGRDELVRIGPDEWEDELWETAGGGEQVEREESDGDAAVQPAFIIFFGENDHWVADEVRDEFIARRRAHRKNRAHIVLDERGWPHDFCIRRFPSRPFQPNKTIES